MTGAPPYVQDHIDHDGQRLGVHRYPAADGPSVLLLPAMGVPAGYYRRFALELSALGLGVAVADLRGTGASTPRAVRAQRYGYAELVADVPVVLDHLHGHGFLDRPLLLIGHSLGGHVGSLHLATEPSSPVRAMALIACGIPWHRVYGWRAPMVHGMATGLRATARVLGHWPGVGFAGRQTHGVIRDWAHTVHTGRLPGPGGMDTDAALAGVRRPVYAVTVADDQFTPPATTEHMVGKFASSAVSTHHYTVEEAGGKLDHFLWARSSAALAGRIAKFAAGM